MNKETLWGAYIAKNPKFETDGASFSPAGLRKFFDQTWQHAHDQGVVNGKVLGAEEERKRGSNGTFEDALKSFMGTK